MRILILSVAMGALLSVGLVQADVRRERFRVGNSVAVEEPSTARGARPAPRRLTEAPTGFDNQTNGYLVQGAEFETITEDTVVPLRSFNDNRFIFEEVETIADGLGPVYNAQSCRECHQNPVTGGPSQIAEQRSGRRYGRDFFESLGGSLIHSRATHAELVEHVAYEDKIRTFRLTTSTLGAGFVEALTNETLLEIRNKQPASLRGTVVLTPVLESPGTTRIGRFGWKSQHSSLESFSADAYLNEMGITSPMLPNENTSSGEEVGYGTEYDPVEDPEDDGIDIVAFADFMRATKAPPRGPITADVLAGETVFKRVGCVTCHVDTLATAPPGTRINGGAFTVPAALGNKIIHPYSDFLLHDVGTGDGIPVQPTPEFASTANKMRTAPLWGLRTRNRLMHDGLTLTKEEAITRHQGQAKSVTAAYRGLSEMEKRLLMRFLESL